MVCLIPPSPGISKCETLPLNPSCSALKASSIPEQPVTIVNLRCICTYQHSGFCSSPIYLNFTKWLGARPRAQASMPMVLMPRVVGGIEIPKFLLEYYGNLWGGGQRPPRNLGSQDDCMAYGPWPLENKSMRNCNGTPLQGWSQLQKPKSRKVLMHCFGG